MLRTRLFRDGESVAEDFPLSEVSDHLQKPGESMWIDLGAPHHDELRQLAEELGLHALAIEDALDRKQRPKLDVYESHLFLTVYAVDLDRGSGALTSSEISVFVTSSAVVTVRQHDALEIDGLLERWAREGVPSDHGTGFLLYGLLDWVVDSHFDAVNALDDEMEKLEDHLFDDRPKPAQVQRRSFELRKSLVALRRDVLPMRELLSGLVTRELGDCLVIDDDLRPYYEDVKDHTLQAAAQTDSLRDLVQNILSTNLTIQGNRLNTIMKKLTGWAAIIAVPTAITGFYGMNVPYPGYEKHSGLVAACILLVVASGLLYTVFRRRDWM